MSRSGLSPAKRSSFSYKGDDATTNRSSSNIRQLLESIDPGDMQDDANVSDASEPPLSAGAADDSSSAISFSQNKYSTSSKTARVHHPWTSEEEIMFQRAVQEFGWGNWKKVSDVIGSKTALQVKNHSRSYSKFLMKQGVDLPRRSGSDVAFGSRSARGSLSMSMEEIDFEPRRKSEGSVANSICIVPRSSQNAEMGSGCVLLPLNLKLDVNAVWKMLHNSQTQ
eukprot:ANDGO_03037.mRNA.1 Myb-like protein H